MKKLVLFIVLSGCFFSCGSSKKAAQITPVVLSNNVLLKGGDGSSYKNAIIIVAENAKDGVASEYLYLEKKYGSTSLNWSLLQQSLVYKETKPYDVLKIKLLKDNKVIRVYFEISSFLGKY